MPSASAQLKPHASARGARALRVAALALSLTIHALLFVAVLGRESASPAAETTVERIMFVELVTPQRPGAPLAADDSVAIEGSGSSTPPGGTGDLAGLSARAGSERGGPPSPWIVASQATAAEALDCRYSNPASVWLEHEKVCGPAAEPALRDVAGEPPGRP